MAEFPYQKFAKARSYDPQALYFGEDHLLVTSGMFQERYRRMYYRDIEAFTMAASRKFLIVLLLFIASIGLFAWMAWAGRHSLDAVPLFLLVPVGILFALMILHIIRGPTVRCALRSGVQTLRLPALSRRRKAEAFQERLIEKADQYQSPFDMDTFRRFVRISRNTPPPMPIPSPESPPPIPGEDSDPETPPPLQNP